MVEWNIRSDQQGGAGMWDTHFRYVIVPTTWPQSMTNRRLQIGRGYVGNLNSNVIDCLTYRQPMAQICNLAIASQEPCQTNVSLLS